MMPADACVDKGNNIMIFYICFYPPIDPILKSVIRKGRRPLNFYVIP
jgi:hypothetical protein